MQAMVLENQGEALKVKEIEKPSPASNQLLIKVHTCGVCRTDLHILDGALEDPKLPLVPGHQIVGTVEEFGQSVSGFKKGQKVGGPWLGYTCRQCEFCEKDQENLCNNARFTGYDIDGGFAEYAAADSRFCLPIPPDYPDVQTAPLLCAGQIGYRSLRKAGEAQKIGLYGFGSTQVAQYQDRNVYAFTRPGDTKGQDFARDNGAIWAGGSDEVPPEKLDAAIIFAPVGPLVPQALKALKKGGAVICAGIHMSEIPAFPYKILWEERTVTSVANLTRKDGIEFLELTPKVPIKSNVTAYPLEKANEALHDLREGNFEGSAVLQIS